MCAGRSRHEQGDLGLLAQQRQVPGTHDFRARIPPTRFKLLRAAVLSSHPFAVFKDLRHGIEPFTACDPVSGKLLVHRTLKCWRAGMNCEEFVSRCVCA